MPAPVARSSGVARGAGPEGTVWVYCPGEHRAASGVKRRRRPAPPAGRRRRRGARVTQHTLSVELEDKPGALARVSQLFSRRGYNIQSLAVGPTERPDISRLTLRVDCSEH